MKKIIKLARLELALLFYSPVAWMTLIIFTIVASISFIDMVTGAENMQTLGAELYMITSRIYNGFGGPGVMESLQSRLYFFIPLVTMGLMSREISSGSLKLLLSSPVKISEIILGKYLAIMLYGLLLMSCVGLFVIATGIAVNKPDYGMIFSGMIGIYLMLCAYAAIGLFMSSLTSYQIVAALLTFTTFAILDFIAGLWQNYDLVRDITYNLSLGRRMGEMSKGLLTSRDVLYFLSIIGLFLGLTMLRLWNARQSASATVRWIRYGSLILGTVVFGYITSRPKMILYADLTHPKINTIPKSAQRTLQELKTPLEITTYVNIFDEEAHDFLPVVRQRDLALLERYQRFNRDMKINYVYYYDSTATARTLFLLNPGKSMDSIAAKQISNYRLPKRIFLKPEELKQRIRLKPEQDNRNVRELRIGKETAFVQGRYDDGMNPFPGDQEYMSALKIIQEGRVKVLFTTGHTEKDMYKRGKREAFALAIYPRLKENLVNNGVSPDTISLAYREVPDSIAALVILDPRLDFTAEELARLKRYIDKGGNLLIGVELQKRVVVDKLLAPLGIRFIDSTILQPSKDNVPTLVVARQFRQPGQTDTIPALVPMVMEGAGAFARTNTGSDFNIETIAQTDTISTWFRPGYVDLQDSSTVGYHPASGDSRRIAPVAVHLSRKVGNKEQRIVITGDADMYANHSPNLGFVLKALSWFTDGKYPLEFEPGIPMEDTRITITKRDIKTGKWIFWALIPGLTGIAGAVTLIRRKRK